MGVRGAVICTGDGGNFFVFFLYFRVYGIRWGGYMHNYVLYKWIYHYVFDVRMYWFELA